MKKGFVLQIPLTYVVLLALLLAAFLARTSLASGVDIQPVVVADNLEHPWGMAFLPDGDILITERPGRLRRIHNGKLIARPIGGLPAIKASGQGGLLDVVLHPQYAQNGWIYLSYVASGEGGMGTEVLRFKLNGDRLSEVEQIFQLEPKSGASLHFGSRLVFDREGYLYITLGERGDRPRAQNLNDHAGSVIRLHDDGSIPKDNPFVGQQNIKSSIYSYGHRNPQGAALNPQSGGIWIHEHGPKGGDELNIIQPGANYGWPVITYGKNYVLGTSIGEGSTKEGMEQPIYYWIPSIAPSGMTFYSGDRIPEWKGDLLIGSLKFQLLVRLTLDGNKVVNEDRVLERQLGRIRDIRDGPDGYPYLLTDERNGKLIRLEKK